MNKLQIIVAVIVGYLVGLAIVSLVQTNDNSGQLQMTPAQGYNSECLGYGNAIPCTLAR